MTASDISGVATLVRAVTAERRSRRRRATVSLAALTLTLLALVATTLMIGNTFYGPVDVVRVLLGEHVDGASFTIGTLRLPRVVLGVCAGFAFGIAGVTFQIMLRNALASPDIIGISSGAGAAAVFAIVVLGLSGFAVGAFALVGALVTASAIAALSYRTGVSGSRLILIGIGVAALLDAATTTILARAAAWDLQAAMMWLTGSLNTANWSRILPLLVACLVLVPVLLGNARSLGALRLGDDTAASLGVRVTRVRILLILAAVALVAFATSGAGPISFVAFLAGPIAARIVGPGASPLLPAGLVGAVLVIASDFAGQHLFADRLPVGVITGIIGAPYLLYLLVRMNRAGAGL